MADMNGVDHWHTPECAKLQGLLEGVFRAIGPSPIAKVFVYEALHELDEHLNNTDSRLEKLEKIVTQLDARDSYNRTLEMEAPER